MALGKEPIGATMSRIDFGVFFFNSHDEGISGNCVLHAKKALCERVAISTARQCGGRWPT
jgi:hypothetical protein